MGDFRLLGEILIDVLSLLNFTPEDIRKIENGSLVEDDPDKSQDDDGCS